MSDSEVEKLRAAWLNLSAKIMVIVQNHMLALAHRAPLTDEDVELGNTIEFQAGFDGCLEMVTRDYIEPLIAAHNEMAATVATPRDA